MNRCTANQWTIIRKLKLNCNTLSVTNECSRILGEGLWTNSSWFLWIRVEVLYEALVVKHKWGTQTNTTKHIREIWQYEWCKAQSKRERVRVNGSIANTWICFEVEHTALRPRLHTEGFSLTCPHRTPTQGSSTEDLGQYNREYTTPLSITNTTSTLRGKA